MKFTLKTVFAAMFAVLLSVSAQAAPITGGVTFGSVVQPAGGMDFVSGTGVNILGDTAFVTCALPSECSGTYAAVTGTVVATYNDFQFAPLVPVTPLWSFTHLGVTYSFDLKDVDIVTRQPDFLSLKGSGTLYATGYTPTDGSWSFSADRATGKTTAAFSSTNDAEPENVPEPATTALLGVGMLGAGFVARRRKAA